MKRLSVIVLVSATLVCSTGCGDKYTYSHEEYLRSISVVSTETAGFEEEEVEEEEVLFAGYSSKKFPKVKDNLTVSFGDEIFSMNSFSRKSGVLEFYLHSKCSLRDCKIRCVSDGKNRILSLPCLLEGVTRITVANESSFQIVGIEGEQFTPEFREEAAVRKYGQTAYRIKRDGIYVFTADSIVQESRECSRGDTVTVPSAVNNVLEIRGEK